MDVGEFFCIIFLWVQGKISAAFLYSLDTIYCQLGHNFSYLTKHPAPPPSPPMVQYKCPIDTHILESWDRTRYWIWIYTVCECEDKFRIRCLINKNEDKHWYLPAGIFVAYVYYLLKSTYFMKKDYLIQFTAPLFIYFWCNAIHPN